MLIFYKILTALNYNSGYVRVILNSQKRRTNDFPYFMIVEIHEMKKVKNIKQKILLNNVNN